MDATVDLAMDVVVWIVAAALAGALVLATVVDTVRLIAARVRLASGRQLVARQKRQIRAQELRAQELRADVEQSKRALQALKDARRDAVAALKALDAVQVELVHEIGAPAAAHRRFRYAVSCPAGLGQVSSKNVVFHKDIWKFTNVAEVWTATRDQAGEIVASAFTARSGLAARPLKPIRDARASADASAGAAKWAA
ncbi:hypothetical protein [Azospirillum sp. ST 5-10]|uniref:hypothetical protein n=1 Tax=unclassified Azospirillum TaxID=2630922 RepID=UPI003F4A5834